MDMAGFAVNLHLIRDKPDVWFDVSVGQQESHFLSGFGVAVQAIEPKADNCTKVVEVNWPAYAIFMLIAYALNHYSNRLIKPHAQIQRGNKVSGH